MNILVALDNESIKNQILQKYGDVTYKHDINCMEDVIEFLDKKSNRITT